MKPLFFFICASMTTYLSVAGLFIEIKKNLLATAKCDHSFGDPSWKFSKVFYDEIHTIPKGTKEWNTLLPSEPGFMISFVCVNITNDNKATTEVAFSPIYSSVTVKLREHATEDKLVHIVAKRHGY